MLIVELQVSNDRMNPLRWFVHRFGGQRWFPPVFKRIVPADGWLRRVSHARLGLTDIAGINGLLLTTTGRRTGEPRTVALMYVPSAPGYVVAGSNWGGHHHPAWSANLLADPLATVAVAGRTEPVKARLVEGAERDEYWRLLLCSWPAYTAYEARVDRDIRVFLLEPAG